MARRDELIALFASTPSLPPYLSISLSLFPLLLRLFLSLFFQENETDSLFVGRLALLAVMVLSTLAAMGVIAKTFLMAKVYAMASREELYGKL